MPELPEVETVVRNLREPLIGHRIEAMHVSWYGTIHSPDPDTFANRIVGQTFKAINRRAKYILCELDDDVLIVHLKMTGRLYVVDQNEINEADRWVRFKLTLDNDKELRFSDVRKFGKVYLTHDVNTVTGKLGPEPLEEHFTIEGFAQSLATTRRDIKAVLLDQSVLAGVGNIYADEALFRAKIHPKQPANTLTSAEIETLHGTVRDALQAGIQYEGASISWYRKPDGTQGESQKHFFAYGRDGEPCANCGSMIVKTRVAQRGTHYCPNCQKLRD